MAKASSLGLISRALFKFTRPLRPLRLLTVEGDLWLIGTRLYGRRLLVYWLERKISQLNKLISAFASQSDSPPVDGQASELVCQVFFEEVERNQELLSPS